MAGSGLFGFGWLPDAHSAGIVADSQRDPALGHARQPVILPGGTMEIVAQTDDEAIEAAHKLQRLVRLVKLSRWIQEPEATCLALWLEAAQGSITVMEAGNDGRD